MSLCNIINETTYPIEDNGFRENCKKTLAENGALVLPDFLNHKAIRAVIKEGEAKKDLAWYTKSTHNVYLTNVDPNYDADHARNKQVISSKGCIRDDQIDDDSPLRQL